MSNQRELAPLVQHDGDVAPDAVGNHRQTALGRHALLDRCPGDDLGITTMKVQAMRRGRRVEAPAAMMPQGRRAPEPAGPRHVVDRRDRRLEQVAAPLLRVRQWMSASWAFRLSARRFVGR